MIVAGSGLTVLCSWLLLTQKDAAWGLPVILVGVLPIVEGVRRISFNRKETRAAALEREQSAEKQILWVAFEQSGRITAASAALKTSMTIEEANRTLERLVLNGQAGANVTHEGIIEFEFPEFASWQRQEAPSPEGSGSRDRRSFHELIGSLNHISQSDFFERYSSLRGHRMFSLFDPSWMADQMLGFNSQAINRILYILYDRITSVPNAGALYYDDRQILIETMLLMKARVPSLPADEARKALVGNLIQAIGNSVEHLDATRG